MVQSELQQIFEGFSQLLILNVSEAVLNKVGLRGLGVEVLDVNFYSARGNGTLNPASADTPIGQPPLIGRTPIHYRYADRPIGLSAAHVRRYADRSTPLVFRVG